MGTIRIDGHKILHQQAGKWQEIGDASFSTRTLTVYRDKSKNFMRVFDGYGFNKEIIDTDRFFDHIVLDEIDGEDHNLYLIPREDIILEGKLYQAEGYERQVFMSMEQLRQYKMRLKDEI